MIPIDLELSFWTALLVLAGAGFLAWFAYYSAFAWSLAAVGLVVAVLVAVIWIVGKRIAYQLVRGSSSGSRGRSNGNSNSRRRN